MLGGFLRSVIDTIFPPQCVVCGCALQNGEKTICTTCRWDMPLTDYWNMPDNFVVERLAGRFPFAQASALMFFKRDSDYRQMIHRMKYGARGDVAMLLGEVYGRYLAQSGLYGAVELVVPIPLHYTKFIKRGYNQSEEFARGIARSMGLRVEAKAVIRSRRTHTQARMEDKEARAANVKDAFRVLRPGRIAGRHILLVDDVITTGATLEACAVVVTNACVDCTISVGSIAVVASSSRYV